MCQKSGNRKIFFQLIRFFLPVKSMRRSTLLISRYLIEELENRCTLTDAKLTELLHEFMKDPLLWRKMKLLKSTKYTKTYQPGGLSLVPVKFYPHPEDWCQLSILSNGSGFSRCFIFVFLLLFYLKLLDLEEMEHTLFSRDGCPTVQHFVKQFGLNGNAPIITGSTVQHFDKQSGQKQGLELIFCVVTINKTQLTLERSIQFSA